MVAEIEHFPVLYAPTLEGLALRPGGRYIDCTAGSGGHAAGILEGCSPDGQLLALDTDEEAVLRVGRRLAAFGSRVTVIQGNFRDLEDVATRVGWHDADGVLFDLGVSSVQLGTAGRGFSFQEDGPLDMRLDHRRGSTAAALLRDLPEQELARLFRELGEEPVAGRIAAAIGRERAREPLATTGQLAELVAKVKGRRGRIHPATMVFQALRIAVNDELGSIAQALPQAVRLLRTGGRLATIAFHSGEDRIVKRFMQEEAKECRCPPAQPICTCDHRPSLRLVTRKATVADAKERASNPRARSARLRLAERL